MNENPKNGFWSRLSVHDKPELLKACCYVLAGVVVAFIIFAVSDIGSSKPATSGPTGSSTTSPLNAAPSYDWSANVKTVDKAIGSEFLDIKTKQSGPIAIYKTAEITGDKTDEALVSLGSSGAYVEYFTLMRINFANKDGSLLKNSKPVIAQFKQKDGEVGPLMFGEGASVMHGETVELVPTTNAVYSGGWGLDPANPDAVECTLDVYVWNEKTSLFEFNKALSESSLSSFCAKISSARE
mgnify:CR=1 FL=1